MTRHGIRNGLLTAVAVAGAGIGGYLWGRADSADTVQRNPDISIRTNDFYLDLHFRPTSTGNTFRESAAKYPGFNDKFSLDVYGSLTESTNPELAVIYEIMSLADASNKLNLLEATKEDPSFPGLFLENLLGQENKQNYDFSKPLKSK